MENQKYLIMAVFKFKCGMWKLPIMCFEEIFEGDIESVRKRIDILEMTKPNHIKEYICTLSV